MNTSIITTTIKRVGATLSKHSPTILTSIGVAGMVSTVVMACKATPKAQQLISDAENDKGDILTPFEKIKATAPVYWPAAAVGAASIGCIIFANSTNLRRQAALAGAYTLSENTLREYQNKVLDTIGERKEKGIRDEIAKDHLANNPIDGKQVLLTKKGDTLCYEEITGRYFKSDIESIKQTENKINKYLLRDGSVSLNQIYYELGLEGVKIGEDLGWNVDNGLIEFDYSSQLASDGQPCLVLNFKVQPIGNFRFYY